MDDQRISQAEWDVMEVLWREHPLTSSEIVRCLEKSRGWAPNTVRTLLKRLSEKNHLQIERRSGKFLYSPKTSRDDSVRRESQTFLGRVFGGASASLLLHFARTSELTAEEADELRRILDGKKK